MSHPTPEADTPEAPDTPGALPLPRLYEGAAVDPPPDSAPIERAWRSARRAWLAVRGPALLAWGLVRRRRVALPAPTLVHHLLALRTDRLGDMVLTTAALLDLRAHYRHARIIVLAPSGPLALLEGHPAVDRLVPLRDGRLPEELVGRVDLAIDFTSDETLLGARLAAATRAPWRIGLAAAGREAFFTLRGPRARRDRHIVELNRDLLAACGVARRDSLPKLHVSAQERSEALARCAALGAAAPRIVVHPGGHYPSQRWPLDRFAQMIGRLTERTGAACLVLTGPGEEEMAQEIAARTPDALLVGDVSVRRLLAFLTCADLFVGNNSGPLHAAAALDVPTLSVAGPTDLRRFMPCGPSDHIVRRPLSCAPCQRGRCWHHTCLQSIDVEEVALAAQAILESAPRRKAAA